MALRPDRRRHDLRPVAIAAEQIERRCMPGRRPRNCSTSAGLRPSSSFTLSAVRAGEATAAATLAGGWARDADRRRSEAQSGSDDELEFAHGNSPFTSRRASDCRARRATSHVRPIGSLARRGAFALDCSSRQPFPGGYSMATIVARLPTAKRPSANSIRAWRCSSSSVVLARLRAELLSAGLVPAYPRPNPTLPPAVIFHGLIFTLWMALLVVQTQLISARQARASHMKLGKADHAARDRC